MAFITLISVAYKINKNKTFTLTRIMLTNKEKALLILLTFLPILSILGTYTLQINNDNLLIMVLLFLIPVYIIIGSHNKFPKRLYPIFIYIIGLSLLLIFMLRFPHISGKDINGEYFMFQITLSNLKWSIILHRPYDTCLSISILPTILQSVMNIKNQEMFFKGIYVFIFSFCPLVIYIISKKYIGCKYAFLASFFFMSQLFFLRTAGSARTNVAIFFIALFVMALFNDNIPSVKKKILIVLFMVSCIFSHYSSTYIFLIIIISTLFVSKIISKKLNFKRNLTLTFTLLLIVFIFFWYSQLTESGFDTALNLVKDVFLNLGQLFVGDLKDPSIAQLSGHSLQNPILSRANLLSLWSTFLLIGIGCLTTLFKYKETLKTFKTLKQPKLLKNKIEIEYLIMALTCVILLISVITLPIISQAYDMSRFYFLVTVFLAPFLIIGGLYVSKFLRIRPTLLILIVLIPYFLFVTGAIYQLAGVQYDPTLNYNGDSFERSYVHDYEVYTAQWLELSYGLNPDYSIYVLNSRGKDILISQGKINPQKLAYLPDTTKINKIKSYITLFNTDLSTNNETYANEAYLSKNKNIIYDAGNSKIYLGDIK